MILQYNPIYDGRQSKNHEPHCEGALLPKTDRIHNNITRWKPVETQIKYKTAPFVKIFCAFQMGLKQTREFTKLTWIVRLSKNKETVDKFTKDVFEDNNIVLNTKPHFELISNPSATQFYYRLTMEIRTKIIHLQHWTEI